MKRLTCERSGRTDVRLACRTGSHRNPPESLSLCLGLRESEHFTSGSEPAHDSISFRIKGEVLPVAHRPRPVRPITHYVVPPHPLCSRHTGFPTGPDRAGTFVSQGLCTCWLLPGTWPRWLLPPSLPYSPSLFSAVSEHLSLNSDTITYFTYLLGLPSFTG